MLSNEQCNGQAGFDKNIINIFLAYYQYIFICEYNHSILSVLLFAV